MDQAKFVAIMPRISADLVDYISMQQNIGEEEALQKLYASVLYSELEKEDTKLWHYSTPMLYQMFLQGEKAGKLEYPDV
ncbi:MAG: hypothetical protein IJZ80_03010 [Clostridia bacterium]|nr:hypothetical protein [Clostridia bacterium]